MDSSEVSRMDFDEHDYLEKSFGNPETQKLEEVSNGGGETLNLKDKDQTCSLRHESDTTDYDGDDHSKHHKSGDESTNHDWKKEKDSSCQRFISRDGDRDHHKGRAEHRDRERDSEKSRDRDGRDRERERDRDNERIWDSEIEWGRRVLECGSERAGDMDRDRKRPRRSKSPSESHQDWDERESSQGKEYKERDGELKERNRESSRKKEDLAELGVDPERDQRTVCANQISLKADESHVYEFFSRADKVQDIRLIVDNGSGHSKGYIEFYDALSVPKAIALAGQPLLGQPVMVKPLEADKILVRSTTAAAPSGGISGSYSDGARRLYVSNLHLNIREHQLRLVFEPFGTVELVHLSHDRSGHCRGFGFVQFARLEDAMNALTLDGNLEIAGRIIKVSAVTDVTGTRDVGTNEGDSGYDEEDALSLKPQASLLQKLDCGDTSSSIAGVLNTPIVNSIGAPTLEFSSSLPPLALAQNSILAPAILSLQVDAMDIPSVDTIGTPSECLLLKNMFDPKLETDPEFFLDVKNDVKEECSRFGFVRHIFVDKRSAGFVYVRFGSTKSAITAQRAFHGRWLSGNIVTATFMAPQIYETKFRRNR